MLILLLVILIISFITIFVCCYIHNNTRYDMELINTISIGFAIVSCIALFFVGIYCLCSYDPGIDEKIVMYQEENAAIEAEIAAVVDAYMTHEKNIYTEIKADSPITLVSLYPELSSNELVSAQINTYVNNNQQIKYLKEKQINQNYVKWWISFNIIDKRK